MIRLRKEDGFSLMVLTLKAGSRGINLLAKVLGISLMVILLGVYLNNLRLMTRKEILRLRLNGPPMRRLLMLRSISILTNISNFKIFI
jgi:hypothetical protein